MSSSIDRTRAGSALTDTFGAIRVINLATRPDRRREMAGELARLGLRFDDGVVKLHRAAVFDDKGPFPLVGARGCYHSHLDALVEAQESGAGNVLLFEDDCDFIADIEPRVTAALDRLSREPWSIFYGGHELVASPADPDAIMPVAPDTWILGGHFVGFRREILPDLIAYLRDGLVRLAADPEGGPKGVDSAYHFFRRDHPHLHTYLAWPKLGFQRPSRTDISPHNRLDQWPLTRDVMGLLRRARRHIAKRQAVTAA